MRYLVKHGSLIIEKTVHGVGSVVELHPDFVALNDPEGVCFELAPDPKPSPVVEAPAVSTTEAPKRRRKETP